jgi:hypothetical protein
MSKLLETTGVVQDEQAEKNSDVVHDISNNISSDLSDEVLAVVSIEAEEL